VAPVRRRGVRAGPLLDPVELGVLGVFASPPFDLVGLEVRSARHGMRWPRASSSISSGSKKSSSAAGGSRRFVVAITGLDGSPTVCSARA
jgi:hypothetical protein